jgi:hypothetical protein
MTTEGPLETAVRVTPSAKGAEEYAVVLAASGIAHRLERTAAGWAVMVAVGDAVWASGALAAYDQENRDEAQVDTSPPAYGETWIGVLIAALLVGFFVVTGPRQRGVIWFDRGSASAQPILSGEVWRTVTALTLHADAAHVGSNAIAGLEGQEPHALAAVAEREDEQPCAAVLPGEQVAHHRPVAVINLPLLRRGGHDHRVGLGGSLAAQLDDEAPHTGVPSAEAVVIDECSISSW